MSDWQSWVLVSIRSLQPSRHHDDKIKDTGAQPLLSDDKKLILAVNGEIYNHVALRPLVAPGVKFKTHSDCEVILHLVSQVVSKY